MRQLVGAIVVFGSFLVVAACNSSGIPSTDSLLPTPTPDTTQEVSSTPCTDIDGDGACLDVDCDDFNTTVHPDLPESCADGRDNDCNDAIDCADTACVAAPACNGGGSEGNCGDGIDDDQDGAIDCADFDCNLDPTCGGGGGEVNCTDGLDDDNDGNADCADTDCMFAPNCGGGGTETDCGNGADDDGDGTIDCSDTDCLFDLACLGSGLEQNCTDGLDDDGDGDADCNDFDCLFDPGCTESDCADNADNEGDGLIDCDDDDCLFSCFFVENCLNGFDDDWNGRTDCDDPVCFLRPFCMREICDNTTDDDSDGLIDCADSDCATTTTCRSTPEACTNSLDDDADGAVDCADSECLLDAACGGTGTCSGASLVANGDFEAGGAGWYQESLLGYDVVLDTSAGGVVRGGSWSAWLGGADEEISTLRLDVRIPAGSASAVLHYWWGLGTDEGTSGTVYDEGSMKVHNASGTVLTTVQQVSNVNGTRPLVWAEKTQDLTMYAGQELQLIWTFETDPSNVSNWFIDDVTLICN